METLTKHHLDRIRGLARKASRIVTELQVPGTGKKGENHAAELDRLTTYLVLIDENIRMIKKVEKIEDASEADDVAA